MRTQKGITLIALVITIIVMLILVAVTITMAVNGGLFQYASDAAKGTNNSIKDESNLGDGNLTIKVKDASGTEQPQSGDLGNLVNTYYTNEAE